MVEPENAVTVTPLRPEDDYSPRDRRFGGLCPPQPETPGPLRQRHVACLVRSEKGLGFSIAGGKGSTPYRAGDGVSPAAGEWEVLAGGGDQPWPVSASLSCTAGPSSPQGIFISRIAEGGAAHRAGTLQVGDRVLSVSRGRGRGQPSTPCTPVVLCGLPILLTSLALADQRGGHGRGPARPCCLSADHRLPHHCPAAGARGWGAPSSQPPATLTPTTRCCHHHHGHCYAWGPWAHEAGPQPACRCPRGAISSGGETPALSRPQGSW